MTARLARICRYPVKSAGGETLERVRLTAGQILPGDRAWGVLHAAALHHLEGDGTLGKWLPKSAFLRCAAAAPLGAITGGWEGGRLHLRHPDRPDLLADPATEEGALLAWLAPLWPVDKAPAARVVRAARPLTDSREAFVSLLSLDSLADLEGRTGRPLGTHRWRANLWVEGWAPQAEHDMRLTQLQIGAVRVKVRERIGRCPATSVDTATGRLDGDMPAALRAAFDHDDFGVYIEVLTDGEIAVGDPVTLL